MNRPIAPSPSGFVLRPPSLVRLVLVVLGEVSVDDLAQALVRLGFEAAALAISTPDEWAIDHPADWPPEPVDPAQVSVNESLVRVSGRFVGPARAFGRDMRIDDTGAVFTVIAAWQYAVPMGARPVAGAAPPATAPPKDHRGTAALVAGMGLLGLGVWSSIRSRRRMEKETERLRRATERDPHAELAATLDEYLDAHGDDERALVELELEDDVG